VLDLHSDTTVNGSQRRFMLPALWPARVWTVSVTFHRRLV